MLDRFFHLSQHDTKIRTEVLGGVTTFVTMAYIIVVNPAILGHVGIPAGAGTVATILAAAFGSIAMGLYANRPIAVAPYMGENAFIAFGLAALGIGWAEALGAVFVSGLAFLVLTLVGVRAWLAGAISPSLKHAFAAGIGLFLAFIGLYETGIVTSGAEGLPVAQLLAAGGGVLGRPDVPLRIGDLHAPAVLIAIFGVLLTTVLMARRVPGAILLGIAAAAMAGYVFGIAPAPRAVATWPSDAIGELGAIAFKLDLGAVFRLSFLPVLLTLFLMSFLDTLATLVGVGAAGRMLDEKGDFPHIEKPMIVDAASCMFSGLVGTSTSGAYIESATGIREGARTGLAAVTTGVLFLAALFFVPVVEALQPLHFAYGPPLIVVGGVMMASIARVDFEDVTEALPAFVTILMMAFTYNIANGLTAGLTIYPLLKLAAGRRREISAGHVTLAVLCAVYYVFGLPH